MGVSAGTPGFVGVAVGCITSGALPGLEAGVAAPPAAPALGLAGVAAVPAVPDPTGLVGPAVGSGAHGVVRRPIEPLGSAYIAGEEWTARAADDRPIDRGTPVTVVAVDGLTVLVVPDSQPSQA